MKVLLKKYLFTPAFDCLNENEQFQYGLTNIDGVDLDFFDKIFFYNIDGIRVANKNINRKNTFNINNTIKNKMLIIYIIKYLIFYFCYAITLKLRFFKDAPTFIFYDNILKKYPGLYFKIFEFSKEDHIFEILATKHKISFIFYLHTIKTINNHHIKYLNNLKTNRCLTLFICPTIYHFNHLKHIFKLDKLYLSKYYGHKRVRKKSNLIYKTNSRYLILLNGSDLDYELIKLAKNFFKGNFIVKPHPFHPINDKSL